MKTRSMFILTLSVSLTAVFSPRSALAQGTGTTTGTTPSASSFSGFTGTTGTGTGANTATSTSQSLKAVTPSSGTGVANGSPSNYNPFVSTYGDPYSMGLPTLYAKGPPTTGNISSVKVTFAKANYTNTAQSASQGGTASTKSTATNYGTAVGVIRNPKYVTVLSDNLPIVVHQSGALQSEVRDVIARSERLPNKNAIQVSVNGNTVILSGFVGTDRERQVAEGIAKLTPGVRDVQNHLQVK